MIPISRFGTLRTIEMLEVARKAKQAARFVVRHDEVGEYFEAAHSLGLTAIRSTSSFAEDSIPLHDYIVEKPGPYTLLAIAYRTPEQVFELDDRSLGFLLGYPSCCIDHFVKSENQMLNAPTSKAHHFAFAATPHRIAPFWMNTFMRDEHVLLSHLPCSLTCERSDYIGRKRALLLREHDPFGYERVREALLGEHTYLTQRFTFIDPL